MYSPLKNKKLPAPAPCNQIKRYLLFLPLHFIVLISFSQTKEIDSSRDVFYRTADDKKKLSALFLLCENANSMPADSVLFYYSQAHSLAVKENNTTGIIQTNLYKANYYLKKGNLDSAENLI